MLQRVQTVFLLIVGLSMLVFLFAPMWQKTNTSSGEAYVITAFYFEAVESASDDIQSVFFPFVIPGILGIISVCLAFISISLYKKRPRQILLSALNALIIGATLVLSVYWATEAENQYLSSAEPSFGYSFGLFMPAIALVFNSMAIRFIRRDERLVRSMDRIR